MQYKTDRRHQESYDYYWRSTSSGAIDARGVVYPLLFEYRDLDAATGGVLRREKVTLQRSIGVHKEAGM